MAWEGDWYMSRMDELMAEQISNSRFAPENRVSDLEKRMLRIRELINQTLTTPDLSDEEFAKVLETIRLETYS